MRLNIKKQAALFFLLLLGAVSSAAEYTLATSGMPLNAVIRISGQEYKALIPQRNIKFDAETVTNDDVFVNVGGGYAYRVSIDNSLCQVSVDFKPCFNPTPSDDADIRYEYMIKMPGAYLTAASSKFITTSMKSGADRIIFIEESKNSGSYYIYDVTAGCYVTCTSTSEGGQVKPSEKSSAQTWKFVLQDDRHSISVLPASVKSPSDRTPAWNCTGDGENVFMYRAGDMNSIWSIEPYTTSSLACPTTLFATPGQEFMHKLIPEDGLTVTDVDFGSITTLKFCTDRVSVGNRYKYIRGTAPSEEGVYYYTVKVTDKNGDTGSVPVKLTVSSFLQSPTPGMGFLTWNWFEGNVSHDKLLNLVKGMKKLHLIDAGYHIIMIDDEWGTKQSDRAQLTYDPVKFPHGISGLIKACKKVDPRIIYGLYSDAGLMTCANYQPGSYGYEKQHAELFDSWGVDMLKYDFCNSQASAFASYSAMGSAIAAINERRLREGRRPFIFNLCEWGKFQPWLWGAEAGGSSWRVSGDSREDWIGSASRTGVLSIIDETRNLWMWSGVNRFNDLDMSVAGLHGLGGPSNNTLDHLSNGGIIPGITAEQARSQMAIWCMRSSPLFLTCDFRSEPKAEANSEAGELSSSFITDEDIALMTNKYLIGIDQDPMGQQAEYFPQFSTGTTDYSSTGYDVYVKDLTGGRIAVAVLNRAAEAQESVSLPLEELYLDGSAGYKITDVWTGRTSKVSGTLSTGTIAPYQTKVYIIGR